MKNEELEELLFQIDNLAASIHRNARYNDSESAESVLSDVADTAFELMGLIRDVEDMLRRVQTSSPAEQ